MFGAGQGAANTVNIVTDQGVQATTTVESAITGTDQIEAYVRAQYSDTPILIDIARCESRFHQFNKDGTVVRGEVNNKDVGIMQINEIYHAEAATKMGVNIYSTEGNVAFGKYLYQKYGVSPWSASSRCWSDNAVAKK